MKQLNSNSTKTTTFGQSLFLKNQTLTLILFSFILLACGKQEFKKEFTSNDYVNVRFNLNGINVSKESLNSRISTSDPEWTYFEVAIDYRGSLLEIEDLYGVFDNSLPGFEIELLKNEPYWIQIKSIGKGSKKFGIDLSEMPHFIVTNDLSTSDELWHTDNNIAYVYQNEDSSESIRQYLPELDIYSFEQDMNFTEDDVSLDVVLDSRNFGLEVEIINLSEPGSIQVHMLDLIQVLLTVNHPEEIYNYSEIAIRRNSYDQFGMYGYKPSIIFYPASTGSPILLGTYDITFEPGYIYRFEIDNPNVTQPDTSNVSTFSGLSFNVIPMERGDTVVVGN